MTTISSQLAQVVGQALATHHAHTPQFVAENLRHLPWGSDSQQATLTQKLTALLDQVPDTQQLNVCQQLLSRFFSPIFFESPQFQSLLADLRRMSQAMIPLPMLSETREAPRIESLQDNGSHEIRGGKKEKEAIALLLLDAENLQLDSRQEKFLTQLSPSPLHIKIAFANWKKLGKYDEELHQRNYDLMHVPSGDDMADGKMITVGSVIHDHYPTVREVFVCSSDKVMTNLCTKLRQQGLTVYQVRKQADGDILILKADTGETFTCPKNDLPTLEDCLQQVKWILQAEQIKNQSFWVKLSTVSQEFHKKMGFPISQVMNIYMPGKRARDLFLDNATDFAVHQASEKAEIYVSLFVPEAQNTFKNGAAIAPSPAASKSLAASTASATSAPADPAPSLAARNTQKQPGAIPEKTEPAIISPVADTAVKNTPSKAIPQTTKALESAIAQIIRDLTKAAPGSCVNIARLGSEFHRIYQCPITDTIKKLDIKKTYLAFLQTCSTLIVQKASNSWKVKLR